MDPTTNDPANINPAPSVDDATNTAQPQSFEPSVAADPAPLPGDDVPAVPPATQPLDVPAPAPQVNPLPNDTAPAESPVVGSMVTPEESAPVTPAADPSQPVSGVSTPADDAPAADPAQNSTPDANQQLGSF